jgi:hypothetical protein
MFAKQRATKMASGGAFTPGRASHYDVARKSQ